eukprot:1979792-Rhodomonas_salina.2
MLGNVIGESERKEERDVGGDDRSFHAPASGITGGGDFDCRAAHFATAAVPRSRARRRCETKEIGAREAKQNGS